MKATVATQPRGGSRVKRIIYVGLFLLLLYGAVHELAPELLEVVGLASRSAAAQSGETGSDSGGGADPARNQSFYSPLHVSILLDVSGSHEKERFSNAKEAVKGYLEALREQSGDVSVIAFGNTARLVERAPLSDGQKLAAAIDSLRPSDKYTDHLAAFVMGQSSAVSRASTDGGRAVLLMVTDRQVSPPPNTLPPGISFDEILALAGLPDMQKSLRVSTTILDFGGTAQEVKAQIGAASVITLPGSRDQAVLLGRKLAAQTAELPPMIGSAPAPRVASPATPRPRERGAGWVQFLAYFLSGSASALALIRAAKVVRLKRVRAKSGALGAAGPLHRLVKEERAEPTRVYFVSSDEGKCRSRFLELPTKDAPPNQVWITSPGFIVPGVSGRVACLQTGSDAKVLLRTTEVTQPIRINGERVRPNSTYALDAGSILSVGRFDFAVRNERPENIGTRGTPARARQARTARAPFPNTGGV